jgi:hypothetical protein
MSNRHRAGQSFLVPLILLVLAAGLGYWLLKEQPGPVRMAGMQERVTTRLMSMVKPDVDEAGLADLVERAHARIGSPDAEGEFDEVAYGINLLRAMSQIALDDRNPSLSSSCSVVQIEIGMGIGPP